MKVMPIRNPLPGEQIIGVVPEMALQVDAEWHKRLHLYTGRNLSATALTTEQAGRAGRLALSGQALSSGVVAGLEVVLEHEIISDEEENYYFALDAGLGLAASGEDVVVARPVRINIGDVPVYTLRSLLGGDTTEPDAGEGTLQPRVLGPSLREFVRDVALPATFPRAGVLVLQPVMLGEVGEYDPDDPCEEDPANYAYEDQRWVDGCRLVFYTWPSEWRVLPEASADRWQNRIAYTIFTAELTLGPQDLLPWENVGVPVALVGFSDAWVPQFVDRYAVVRDGGKYARRVSLIAGKGDPYMWQARIRQFAEQAASINDSNMSNLAAQFRHLPPVSILPKAAVDPMTKVNAFFPETYSIDIAPVPLEQLDVVFEASASLQPFDTFSTDQVRVLVPVPQKVFEPGLLVTEVISPEFEQTIQEFIVQRNEALRRRQTVRLKHSALVKAIKGEAPTYPPDIDRQEASEFDDAPTYTGRAHISANINGMHQHYFSGTTATLAVAAGEWLFTYIYLDPDNPPSEVMLQWNSDGWEHRAYWGANRLEWGLDNSPGRYSAGVLPRTGRWLRLDVPAASVGLEGADLNGIAFTLFDGRAAWGITGKLVSSQEQVWFEEGILGGESRSADGDVWRFIRPGDVPTPLEEIHMTEILEDAPPRVLPLIPLKANIGASSVGSDTTAGTDRLDNVGLERYIQILDSKIARSGDTIDFGFLRVQTDIYRIRQLVLNTESATRLAVSPTLASIAKGESAAATKEEISTFYNRLKSTSTVAPQGAAAPTAAPSPLIAGGEILSAATLFSGPATSATLASISGSTLLSGITTQPTVVAPTFPLEFLQPVGEAPAAIPLVISPTLTRFLSPTLQAGTGFVAARIPSVIDVQEQTPIIGSTVIHTTSVAERIEAPKAPEAKDFSASSNHDIVRNVLALGFTEDEGDDTPEDGISLTGLTIPVRTVANEQASNIVRPLTDFRDRANLGQLLQPAVIRGTDEAAFFATGVDVLDNAVATLRIIEGRVQEYKRIRQACQNVLNVLQGAARGAESRLNIIGSDLAEARHDVAVSRSLKAEEEARLRAINDRRQAVIRDYVEFLVFCRPRATDALRQTPVHAINPGFTAATVPQCLDRDIPVPAELRAIVDLLRDVPLNWLVALPPLVQKLDHVQVLQDTIAGAKLRAQVQTVASSSPAAFQITSATGLLGTAITSVYSAQQQVVAQYRVQVAQSDVRTLRDQSWSRMASFVAGTLSPGDLIDGSHGRSDLTSMAAGEINTIARVAACLYAAFSDVLPSIRLDWAERLSQYDTPVNLRNLSSLVRWGEIEYLDRREMQAMVDWLFQRVDNRQAQAADIMNDIVRICILLASHAPVSQIITGYLPKPTVVRPGTRVTLNADMSKLRVGMHVLMYSGNAVSARGVVEDLGAEGVAARVIQTVTDKVELEQNARVQFAAAETAALNIGQMKFTR